MTTNLLDFDSPSTPDSTTNLRARRGNENEDGDDSMQPRHILFGLSRRRSSEPSVAWKHPSKVEPKTHFANERTLIQWLSAAMLVSTIALITLEQHSDFREIGLGLLGFAAAIVLYSAIIYTRRVRLLLSGQPYGYVDRYGPTLLSVALLLGIACLIGISLTVKEPASASLSLSASIQPEAGLCELHEMTGVSRLEFQPSDVFPMTHDGVVMVVSLETVSVQGTAGATETLISVPGANLEGLTSTGSFVYALSLSETSKKSKSELIELEWDSDKLLYRRRWEISTPRAEGIAYVPGSPDRLYISGDLIEQVGTNVAARGVIEIYDIPDNNTVSDAENPLSGRPLNANLINRGLVDSKIAALYYFEDVFYVLHDNDRLVRAWDLNGTLLSEWKLPTDSKQWEGMALQRQYRPLTYDEHSLLRGGQASGNSSGLLLHLAMDSPPEVWTLTVQEGKSRGEIVFPDCATV